MTTRQIEHALSRTLTDVDNSWYTLLTLNTAPHFDHEYGKAAEFGRTLMNSTFTLAVALNIVANECPGRLVGLDICRLTAPMFGGDTLSIRSRVETGEHGLLRISSVGRSQDGTEVIVLDQRVRPDGTDPVAAALAAQARTAPLLPPERSFATPVIAPALDDFTVGDRYDHEVGRTILADEAISLALVSLNRDPLHFDRHLARFRGLPDILVDPGLLFAITLGLSVRHTTQRSVANLGWKDARLHHPAHPGDTLYAETEVVSVRRSASRPGQGIVGVRTLGRNERDQVVASFERSFLIKDRTSREAEERTS